ncbi:cytochrome d ubiquinol oxidase subunit II, partial [Stenotrophomonas maltophilia]|uniref:cytochrome d ubiquinol oxidase subunit II n=1 Tax=Stenotrophomonas maltophilia TaxID=40324 RepID=UPI00313EAE3B
SSSQPTPSLTVWDASSSHLTLWLMLLATAVFLPIILAYPTWVYRVLKGKTTTEEMGNNPNAFLLLARVPTNGRHLPGMK